MLGPADKANKLNFRSFSIGPKFMLQAGLEHVKLSASYSLLFSKKLIQSLEIGFCLNL
jgi:hypothetical protein